MKTWFTTTANVESLEDKLNKLEAEDHTILTVTAVSGKIVIVSYTESA